MVNKGIVYIGDVSGNLGTINSSGQIRVEAAVSIPPISSDVSGNSVRISGQTVYLPNDGVNNVVSISGQTVVASVNVAANVSGNTVYLVDDGVNNKVKVSGQAVLISGQTVTISNIVSTGVSGQTIYLVNDSVNNITKISGQLVAVSGIVNIGNASIAVTLPANAISGNASRISGQTIYLVDDSINNKVKISGQLVAVSGIVAVNSLPVISVSGNAVLISGQTVAIAGGINSNVSGNTIYLVNNGVNNVVQISGQTVVASVVTNISGQVVATSGATIYLVDNGVNNVVKISGQTVIASVSLGTTPTSGDASRISGQTIYLVNDSVNNITKISGQLVAVSGIVNIGNTVTVTLPAVPTSGDAARISGQTIYIIDDSVNNKVKVSGQTVSVSGIVAVNSLPVISVSGNIIAVSGSVAVNSLPVISVSGNAVRTSGQTTYLVNDGVNNVVSISGQTVVASVSMGPTPTSGDASRISGQTIYLVNDSINNVVKVSGQYVTVSGSVEITNPGDIICSISGNTVYLISGFNPVQVSGQSVRLPNDGVNNVVSISGQTVVASVSMGPTPTSGDAARVSGQTIYLVSGNNPVMISGQMVRLPNDGTNNIVTVLDVNGRQFTVRTGTGADDEPTSEDPLLVASNCYAFNVADDGWSRFRSTNAADGYKLAVSISGQPVTANVTTNISGQVVAVSGATVYFVDNGVNNVVKISGQTVVASVSMGPTPTSGDASRISGQTIYLVNDSVNNISKISGQLVAVSGIVNIGNSLTIATLPVISVSGSHVSVSGSVMTLSGSITNISGNVVRVSGETVSVSGVVAITGGVSVNVSGGVSVSGNKVVVSGEPVRLVTPTAIRTRAELACVALSGGTQLLSGDVRKATVLNAGSAGTVMYIGSTTDPPFSGFGFRLVAGNGLTIETNNFNNIRSFGATSGIMISYIGEQYLIRND